MRVSVWAGKGLSRAMYRVETALIGAMPPGVEPSSSRDDSDLEIVHVIGTGSIPSDLGVRPYAMIQYCLRSTEEPDTAFWLPMWSKARAVWSYYDLAAAMREDGLPGDASWHLFEPLGVDGSTFFKNGDVKAFCIGTSGYVPEAEGVFECHEAALRVGGLHAHLGPERNIGLGDVTYYHDITDAYLRGVWASCDYVAALRRGEGFELPAIEGLACGARPIAFDQPHYRRWLGEHADYVPEVASKELVEHLAERLATPPREVTEAERDEVIERFSWPRIASEFWEMVL